MATKHITVGDLIASLADLSPDAPIVIEAGDPEGLDQPWGKAGERLVTHISNNHRYGTAVLALTVGHFAPGPGGDYGKC